MDLEAQLDAVGSREDLVSFVRALLADFRDHREQWENRTLEDYFDSMAAWIEDSANYSKQVLGDDLPGQPNWKFLGDILIAPKHYE